MAEQPSHPRLIRFGSFEADVKTGELRKAGVKLKFSGQPFQVLAFLLERPGDVVTREELQKRLWPDTFVDVERNLNTAVKRIREVLGDSAESPRFVETLPRRGYRFICPVEAFDAGIVGLNGSLVPGRQNGNRADLHGAVTSGKVEFSEDTAALAGNTPTSKIKPWSNLSSGYRKWLLWGGAVLAAGLGTLAWYLHRPLPAPRVTDYPQITHDGHRKWLGGTDGSRLYFNELSDFAANQVGVAGGDITQIPIALRGPVIRGVSPDGSTLLIQTWDDENIWSAGVLGGPLRHLTTIDTPSAAWSPEERRWSIRRLMEASS